MKRVLAVILLVLMFTVTAGCGDSTVAVIEKGPYRVAVNGQQLNVDPVHCTITAENGDVYAYVLTGTEVTFTYPNGCEYIWDYSSGIGYGSLIDPSGGGRYLDGMALESALAQEVDAAKPGGSNPAGLICAVLCFCIGGLNLASPYTGWYLSHGWKFRDAEPSDAALVMCRISGGIAVIIGVILLFI